MNRGPNALRILSLSFFCVAGCAGELDASPASAAPPGEWTASADDGGVGALARSAASPSAASPSAASPSAAPAGTAPSLGELPSELADLQWPTRPSVTREVTVSTAAELEAAVATPGTRILTRGLSGGDVWIGASDIEIVADAGSSFGQLLIAQGTRRVRIEGGRWTTVRVEVPADFSGGAASYRPELMAEDVSLEGLTIDSGAESAYEIRGKRIAIVGNDVTAGRYSVWCGDTGDYQTEDLILYDNVFRSAGPESTVRLVSVLRSATISNVISNSYKHNYRIHGVSDLNFAADNLLAGTGVMLGTMEGDSLGRVWFDDNVMHHDSPDLFNPAPAIGALVARRNTVYARQHDSFYGGAVGPGWTLSENQVAPYQPPPAF